MDIDLKTFSMYLEEHQYGDASCTSCSELPRICRFCESFIHNEYIYDFDYNDDDSKVDDIVKVAQCENPYCEFNEETENISWRKIYLPEYY